MWAKMGREGSWEVKAVAAVREEVRRRKKDATVAWAMLFIDGGGMTERGVLL